MILTTKGGNPLFVLFVLLFVCNAYAISVFSTTEKGVEIQKDGTGKVTVQNTNPSPVIIKTEITGEGECNKSYKVFPKVFTLQPKETQVIKILEKQKQLNCRLSLTFEELKDITPGQNQINTRFILAIPIR